MPDEYHHWLPTLARGAAKTAAVSIAWYLQVAASAYQSALKGGLLCSRSLLRWANERGYVALGAQAMILPPSACPALCTWTFCVWSGSVERLVIWHVGAARAIRHVAGPPE